MSIDIGLNITPYYSSLIDRMHTPYPPTRVPPTVGESNTRDDYGHSVVVPNPTGAKLNYLGLRSLKLFSAGNLLVEFYSERFRV